MNKPSQTRILTLLVILAIMIQLSHGMSVTSLNTHQKQSHARNLRTHTFSPSVSNQLKEAIKLKIISNLSTFKDQTFAQQLKEDLNQDKDENRKLKQISPQSAEELFKIFGIKGIVCDTNGDGVILKEQLQCLNYIWKYYVPQDTAEN